MKFKSLVHARLCSFIFACGIATVGQFAGYSQTNIYLFTGSKTNITLSPGTYQITAYGAQGGPSKVAYGGAGAEMQAQFSFSGPTTLTLLVGGAGGGPYIGISTGGGGGGGGSFVVNGSKPVIIAGGGGGAAIDPYPNMGGSGLIGTNGGDGTGYQPGNGGTNGNGGGAAFGNSAGGAGGGGFYSNGASNIGGGGYGGYSFLAGGYGGNSSYVAGGFGGGGGGAYSGGGGGGGFSGGGGGGSTDFGSAGLSGGGGSYIDSSATAITAEVSGIASPDGSPNGEIIISTITIVRPVISIQLVTNSVILTWSDPTFSLQTASEISGVFTNVPGAQSPYTNSIIWPQQFFRLVK